MSSNSSEYTIPDLLAQWPWRRTVNAHLEVVQDDANAWVGSFELFKPEKFAKFKACNFNYLRISCDLMSFYFAFDEYTDLATRDEAMEISKGVMDTFRDTETPTSNKINEMARQFFKRTIDVVGNDVQGIERFIIDFGAYTSSIIQEADDRDEGLIRTVSDYLVLRRDTCGGKPSFSFFGLGLNIPDEVFEHPLVMSMIEGATDLIAITNDMHSYGLEYSRGLDGHNVITAIMHEHNIGLQEALYWLSGFATATIGKFLADLKNLPSWGKQVDGAVKEFFNRVGRCVRGYDQWSYETKRYYGDKGLKVQQTRKIILKPRDGAYLTREQLEFGSDKPKSK
ncbi:isoprenoid synthase domain-containing protein [Gymnopilus junonius]|uniref:Terpene synthase n=1 Tax=Gymnopilus junonius TaxID=109634 RepID=A0A9P5NHH7_GYMJU|nr:isoprenoid synthase domain-containing protein [Gymnopilus junonius]